MWNSKKIEVFDPPYEAWSERRTTIEEALKLQSQGLSPIQSLHIKEKLLNSISTHYQAAEWMLRRGADNALANHINRALDDSKNYHALRKLMPKDTPEPISSYQKEFSSSNFEEVDKSINTYGTELYEGQILFHGGLWPQDRQKFTTLRPFSTSFCPQVALRNAEWKGKAFDKGRIEIFVVQVKRSKTKAYVYERCGSHGHENEVVFSSGAEMSHVSEKYICDYSAYKTDNKLREERKTIPAYIIEVTIE